MNVCDPYIWRKEISSRNSEILTSEEEDEEAAKFVSSPKTILSGDFPSLPVHFFNDCVFSSRWNYPVWTKPVSLQSNISPALHRRNSCLPIPIKSDQIFRSPFPLATPTLWWSASVHIPTYIYSFEERRTTFGWHFKTNREVRQLTFLIGWNEIFNNRGCGLEKQSTLLKAEHCCHSLSPKTHICQSESLYLFLKLFAWSTIPTPI